MRKCFDDGGSVRVVVSVASTNVATSREQKMSEKDLRKQKMPAEIDAWRAEADKLEAQAKGASADAQLELNERLEALMEKGKEAWDSLKE